MSDEKVTCTQDKCYVNIKSYGDMISIETTDVNGNLISELRMNNNNFTKALVSNDSSRGMILVPIKEKS